MKVTLPEFSLRAKNLVPGSKYRHYKGGEYKVVVVGRKEDDLSEVVVYESLETGDVWVRPVAEFFEQVTTEDYQGQRFVEVERLVE